MALKAKINAAQVPNRDQPLSVHKLSVTLSGAPVIRELSLELKSGEILGISGVNGAGKSTLVKTISGTLDVSSSGIEYSHALHNGEDFMDLSPQQRYKEGIHCVFEGRKLFSELTVKENLEVVMVNSSKKEIQKRIEDVIELFPKMGDLLNKKAKHCSGGQQQVVAIARSIMKFPSVLILDEPTLGLSPVAIKAVGDVLKVLVTGTMGVIVFEQRASFIADIADRKLVLERGKITEPVIEASRATEWKPK